MSAPRPAGRWDNLVVICSGTSWDAVKLPDRQLAEHLGPLAPVLFVDPPLSRLTPLRQPSLRSSLQRPRLRLVAPSIARLTPVVLPGPLRPGMACLTTVLLRRLLRRTVASLGGSVRAVLMTSPLLPVLGACGEHVKIYWAQDDYVGGAQLLGQSAERLRRAEERVAGSADVVLAASPLIAQAWRSRGLETLLFPNGCNDAIFAGTDNVPLPRDVTLPRPLAGFIGHIADRVDFGLLETVAERGISLLLVGPVHPKFDSRRLETLLKRPNVCWVGFKPFDELPSYMRAIDVGLVPYTRSMFNLASFPLKMLEYLAAGRAVVSTDLPATRWLDTELITIASEPAAFAGAVARLLAQPDTPDLRAKRRRFAASHSWTSRARDLVHELQLANDSDLEQVAEATA